jgi:hypothetical protein
VQLQGLAAEFSRFSGYGSTSDFPDPFIDIASLTVPRNQRVAQYWCEHIMSRFGFYKKAIERKNAYFLTDIEVNNASEDETEKWKHQYGKVYKVIPALRQLHLDRDTYGNAYATLLVTFKRFLRCPKCGNQYLLDAVANNPEFKFDFDLPSFIATCPNCKVGSGYRGAWKVEDRDDDQPDKLGIKIWNPHEIEMVHHIWTGETLYLWRIPEDFKRQVRQKHLFIIKQTPLEVLKAIHLNQVYLFKPGRIFHMKEPTLSGIYNRGWGVPPILAHWRQMWNVQVLHRQNEAIGLDYVIPFRVITPAPTPGRSGGGQEPLMYYSGGDFRAQTRAMLARHRRDPAGYNILPFPVNFQTFGADANQLAPVELLEHSMQTLLDATGTPMELYRGTLQLQAVPVALRLYESTHCHVVQQSNDFLAWLAEQTAEIQSWETVDVTLKRVTIADNIEEKMMAAQLMMSEQLSATTVLGQLGYVFKKEQKQLAEEDRIKAELAARNQQEMQQSGFAEQIAKGQGDQQGGGQPGANGQAAGGGGGGAQAQQGFPGMPQAQGPVSQYLATAGPNTPMRPQDMQALAQSLADELTSGIPEGLRRSELMKLKNFNPQLHIYVRGLIDQKRSQTRQAAGNQAVAQMQSGAA